jgi:hypothetical protein
MKQERALVPFGIFGVPSGCVGIGAALIAEWAGFGRGSGCSGAVAGSEWGSGSDERKFANAGSGSVVRSSGPAFRLDTGFAEE